MLYAECLLNFAAILCLSSISSTYSCSPPQYHSCLLLFKFPTLCLTSSTVSHARPQLCCSHLLLIFEADVTVDCVYEPGGANLCMHGYHWLPPLWPRTQPRATGSIYVLEMRVLLRHTDTRGKFVLEGKKKSVCVQG